jgi:hypothetical protein
LTAQTVANAAGNLYAMIIKFEQRKMLLKECMPNPQAGWQQNCCNNRMGESSSRWLKIQVGHSAPGKSAECRCLRIRPAAKHKANVAI